MTTQAPETRAMNTVAAIRFIAKVYHEPNTGCWLWTGSTTGGDQAHSYGQFWNEGRQHLAHRVSYEHACSLIPDGLQVLHRCDVGLCVNPAHLFLGTQSDNIQDMDAKGRRTAHTGHGEANSASKLTAMEVLAIRRLASQGNVTRDIAAAFQVDASTVRRIRARATWGHLPQSRLASEAL